MGVFILQDVQAAFHSSVTYFVKSVYYIWHIFCLVVEAWFPYITLNLVPWFFTNYNSYKNVTWCILEYSRIWSKTFLKFSLFVPVQLWWSLVWKVALPSLLTNPAAASVNSHQAFVHILCQTTWHSHLERVAFLWPLLPRECHSAICVQIQTPVILENETARVWSWVFYNYPFLKCVNEHLDGSTWAKLPS